MPCSDGGYGRGDESKAKLDHVTRLLCESMKAGVFTGEALLWFEQHQREDAARLAREKRSRMQRTTDLRRQIERINREIEEAEGD